MRQDSYEEITEKIQDEIFNKYGSFEKFAEWDYS
jgi:hypothetical protein